MARYDDDRDRISVPIIFVVLLILMAIAFFAYQHLQKQPEETSADETPVEAAEPVEPVVAPEEEAEPLPVDEPEVQPEPEPQPIEEPEPVAPPPPPEPEVFSVYFDLMKASLTDEAAAEIAARLDVNNASQITRITVGGHTDSAGRAEYNRILSEERARSVRDFISSKGVASSSIELDWYGETQLATPTGDSVREPLNRRAEVTIHYN